MRWEKAPPSEQIQSLRACLPLQVEQTTAKRLWQTTQTVHEDERLAVMHVAAHLVCHDAAQGVEPLAYVRRVWIQVECIRSLRRNMVVSARGLPSAGAGPASCRSSHGPPRRWDRPPRTRTCRRFRNKPKKIGHPS